MGLQLYDYQELCVNGLRNSFISKKKAPLLVVPTGGGKTVIFSYMAKQSSLNGKKIIILVHRIELLKQTSNALSNFGVIHGLINPNYTQNLNLNVQVASVLTVGGRLNYLTASNWEPDLIIIDEAHHATAGTWRKIIDYFSNAKVIGVTATPIRSDGVGLGLDYGGIFDDIVIGPTVKELISRGFLTKPRVFAPKNNLDFSSVKKNKNDFDAKKLGSFMSKPTITGSAIAHYKKICPGVPTVVFCVNIAHAEQVAFEFKEAGFKAYSVDGKTDENERKKILDGLANGYSQVVTSVNLISEGTDIPAIVCAIFLRPTESKGLYMQQGGRALRIMEGKTVAYILDHVGNTMRHGMLCADQVWSLAGEPKKNKSKKTEEESPKVIVCDSCLSLIEASNVCPECGHVVKKRDSKPKQIEGSLIEISENFFNAQKKEKKIEQGKAQSLESLRALSELRGYSPKWADNVFLARQKKAVKSDDSIGFDFTNNEAEKTEKTEKTEFNPKFDFSENLDF